MKRLGFSIILLLLIMGCTSKDKYTMMRAGLDSINMLNRTYQPFTIADVEPYVHFFDTHGTPNDRMLAHYLLGRAYYDHGEAPMALKCYQQAIEHSDTTRDDCDYAQLSRVYAQMGNVFYAQSLYQEHLNHYQHAQRYAWMAKDTLAALSCYEQEAVAYKRLQKTDSALYAYEDISKYYIQMNRPTDAAITLGGTLKIFIESGSYEHAKRNMSIYESASGLFDQQGNIKNGKEIYYYLKGLLYLQEHRLDSAEYWFRKELHDGKDFNNQHAGAKGLAGLYQILHKPDSVAKYYQYAYEMNDSIYTKRTAKEIERIKAMYDYSESQRISMEKEREAENYKKMLVLVLIVVVVSIYLIYKYVSSQRRKNKEKMVAANIQYANLLSEYQQTRQDLDTLQSGYEQFKAEKQKAIEKLQEQLAVYQSDSASPEMWDIEQALLKSRLVSNLHQLAGRAEMASTAEWRDLRRIVSEQIPAFYQRITDAHANLTGQEILVCILCKLRFIPSEMVVLLNLSSQRITNLRSSINQKLFNVKGAHTLESHLSNL